MILSEEWLPICGLSGYEISSAGRVRRTTNFKPRSPHKSSNGYLNIRATVKGKVKTLSIHRLVAAAFIGPCPIGLQVRHLDGDKENNQLFNLKYGTAKENGDDNRRLCVMPRGESVNTSKLTKEQAVECKKLVELGMSPTKIANTVGVPRNAVFKIKYGLSWAWLDEEQANNRNQDRVMR